MGKTEKQGSGVSIKHELFRTEGMMTERRETRVVRVGNLKVGGNNPIYIQSMTNTHTGDVTKTVRQIRRLEKEGCEIIRVAVRSMDEAEKLAEIRKRITIPIVADIHFNHSIAIESVRQGVDKIRINPGNIGGRDRLQEVVRAAGEAGIPIRIGVNSGSLEDDILNKHGHPCPGALVESAKRNITILEDMDFQNIVISIKSTDVNSTIEAYRGISGLTDHPLHIGLTEAGLPDTGVIKSSIALGCLLSEGIGDTIRVSLTSPPIDEVRVAKRILQSLGIRSFGPEIIACPTCGRMQIDLISLTREVERRLASSDKHIKVAILGCAVNGPGEAKEADIGIAGGKGSGYLIKGGEFVRKVSEDRLIDVLIQEIESIPSHSFPDTEE